ncbi:MAG: C69 family dipeptidase [Negativicutes bacterium]|nr:C69 family dipeptidase [Negativicutes bacterium]
MISCLVILTFLLAVLVAGRRPAEACTTVVVGRSASINGNVLVGHNEDDWDELYRQYHYMPRRTNKLGDTVRAEKDGAAIPCAYETLGYYWAESRQTVDGGASFTDFFVNENGVVVTSNNCGEPRDANPDLVDGGLGYLLRRSVAERAKNARDGLGTAMLMVDQYGYRGCRTYTIADQNECWLLVLVGGRHYAAVRVPDDQVVVIANHLPLRLIDLPPRDNRLIVSRGLVEYAKEKKWYTDGEKFDFYHVFQHPAKRNDPRSTIRQRHGLRLLSGTDYPENDLPFSVRPARKITVKDLKQLLSYHYEGTEDDLSLGYRKCSPHATEKRTICSLHTIDSFIMEYDAILGTSKLHIAPGRPCLTTYKQFLLSIKAVPDSMYWLSAERAMDTHFSVQPSEFKAIGNKLWPKIRREQDAAESNYASAKARVRTN